MNTRPDIHFAVISLSRQSNAPRMQHMKALERIIQYIYHTKHEGLKLNSYSSELQHLSAYTDADLPAQGKPSNSGGIIYVGTSPIYWYTKKQKCTSGSTLEAELYALCTLSKLLDGFRRAYIEMMDVVIDSPIPVYCDSQCAIDVIKREQIPECRNFIQRRHRIIKEYVETGHISIFHVPTDDNPADSLTKPLMKSKHQGLASITLGHKNPYKSPTLT